MAQNLPANCCKPRNGCSDALPEAIIERFKGKVMAIVAVEMDQVRRKGDKDIDGSILQEDISGKYL